MKLFYSESDEEGDERKQIRVVLEVLHMHLFHCLKNIEDGK